MRCVVGIEKPEPFVTQQQGRRKGTKLDFRQKAMKHVTLP
jgi:hypothetical protein